MYDQSFANYCLGQLNIAVLIISFDTLVDDIIAPKQIMDLVFIFFL
jgi:hypothetical protein